MPMDAAEREQARGSQLAAAGGGAHAAGAAAVPPVGDGALLLPQAQADLDTMLGILNK
jgi:hypothetical protein